LSDWVENFNLLETLICGGSKEAIRVLEFSEQEEEEKQRAATGLELFSAPSAVGRYRFQIDQTSDYRFGGHRDAPLRRIAQAGF